MICLVMQVGPFFWIYACTRFAFTTLGSLAPTVSLLQYKYMWLQEKTWLWQCGLLEEALGHLDLLVTWIAWISWTFGSLEGALGFLTSRTFGNFASLGNLDLLVIWILDLLARIIGLMISWDSWPFFGSISSWTEFWLPATNFIFA